MLRLLTSCVPLLLSLVFLCSASLAQANCIDLEVTVWPETLRQRALVAAAVAASVGEPVTIGWASPLQVGQVARLCADTADLSALTSASAQATVQAFLEARAATEAAKATETSGILTELETNPFCRTATLAQINARIDAELDTQKAAIQVDIDAATNIATAKVAMTSLNNRLTATVRQTTKQLAKCMVGFMRLQQ